LIAQQYLEDRYKKA